MGFDIIGIDYNDYLPWIVQKQIKTVYDKDHERYDYVYVIANSIGAYFAMNTLQNYHGNIYVRENPISWNVSMEILYAENDNLMSRQTVDRFVNNLNSNHTV